MNRFQLGKEMIELVVKSCDAYVYTVMKLVVKKFWQFKIWCTGEKKVLAVLEVI